MASKFIISVDMMNTDGRYNGSCEVKQLFDSFEDAQTYANEYITRNFNYSGDYTIIKRTIDEVQFSVTDEVVKEFSYFKEVGRFTLAEKFKAYYKRELDKELENRKKCRTDEGRARKDKRIDKLVECIVKQDEILAERKK